MNKDLAKAKKILCDTGSTCVLCKGGSRVESQLRGVAPLVELLDMGMDFSGYSAADKVVGKGAALLYALLGIKEIYALVISESALSVLQNNSIICSYDTLVPHIINRRGDGICPIESATMDIENPLDAPGVIVETLEKLRAK